MDILVNRFTVSFSYPVYFSDSLFDRDSQLWNKILGRSSGNSTRKLLFVIDKGLLDHHPALKKDIQSCFKNTSIPGILCCDEILVVPGGEEAKSRPEYLQHILEAVERNSICRHSFLIAIGGGAVLDMVGFAAAISHRGVKHIRIPTTILSQNDSGIGVKNSVNAFNKKNFIGTFAPPFAVINDYSFLKSLNARDWRSGLAEAVKVALIKDVDFFEFLENHCQRFNERDEASTKYMIKRCAQLHMEHIAGGDPFESGSSRPLDFGHWSAHKLEQLSNYRIKHGEAVAIGIALDATISKLLSRINEEEWKRIMTLLLNMGFELFVPELVKKNESRLTLVDGLHEFREHLGGELTITLLDSIGKGVEVHSLDADVIVAAIGILKEIENFKAADPAASLDNFSHQIS